MKGKLIERHCKSCEGGVVPLTREAALTWMQELEKGWTLSADALSIEAHFAFKNYYHTIAFVNAVAYIVNQENHHPDLQVSYNRCAVRFTTHAIKGLSENDFICAAKIDALIAMNQ